MNKDLFTRSKLNPILMPNPGNWWEARKLYNPAAIYHNGEYHLFYRSVGIGENWKSSICHAVSKDGEIFERFDHPVLVGENEMEKRGLEDPRITRIGEIFYMTYTAYDGKTPRLSVATSSDLEIWQKKGSVFKDWNFSKSGGTFIQFEKGRPQEEPELSEWSKSGGIFPEKINGKYLMMFGDFKIWFAESDDGLSWEGDQKPFLEARGTNYFDNTFVEMGPPPIKTEKGWLVLYHGINEKQVYNVGFLLLDLTNPRNILYRSDEQIFGPAEYYEMSGIVDVLPGGLEAMQKMSQKELELFLIDAEEKGIMPKVTFCSGAVVVGQQLRIYYGASDTVICTATTDISDILDLVP